MKKCLLALLFVAAQLSFSQQIVPMSKTKSLQRRFILKNQIHHLNVIKDTVGLTEIISDSLSLLTHRLDSIEDKVFIYGFGSSDAVGAEGVTANGGFSFGVQPHMWDRLFLSIGIGAKVVRNEKQDSVKINSIFFPDVASSVAYAHYEFSISTLYRLHKYNLKKHYTKSEWVKKDPAQKKLNRYGN
jgi:hypothetical protein